MAKRKEKKGEGMTSELKAGYHGAKPLKTHAKAHLMPLHPACEHNTR